MNSQKIKHQQLLNTHVKSYYFWKLLGSGASAHVYLAINEKNSQRYAVKVIPKQYVNSDKRLYEFTKNQIFILKSCQNPNVVKCYQVLQTPVSILIVMEYCDRDDLQKYLNSKKHLSEDHALMYLRQILNGFKGLHELKTMHRDFKLSNILLTKDKICKIADLGFAKTLQDGRMTKTILGTYVTMAPEVIRGQLYNKKADIWSIGIILYQMITGQYPFFGRSGQQILKIIEKKPVSFEGIRISHQCEDFIRKCLTVDQRKRISWNDLYKHPFVNDQRIQIQYGLFLPDYISKNKQFYSKEQLYQPENPEQFTQTFLNSSQMDILARQISKKKQGCIDSVRISQASEAQYHRQDEVKKIALKCVMYLNSLSHPFKFLSTGVILDAKWGSKSTFNYIILLYKKALSNLLRLRNQIQNDTQIFPNEKYWEKFKASHYYQNVKQLVKQTCRKAIIYIDGIQCKMATKNSPKLKQKFSQEQRKQFYLKTNHLLKQFLQYIQETTRPTDSFIYMVQSLLFFLDHKGKRAQQFDLYMTRQADWKCVKYDIIEDIKKQMSIASQKSK